METQEFEQLKQQLQEQERQIADLKRRVDEQPAYFGQRFPDSLISRNFKPREKGWALREDGSAEFGDTLLRGRVVTNNTAFVFNTNFESLDAWSTINTGGRGTIALESLGAVAIDTGNQANDETGLAMDLVVYGQDFDNNRLILSSTLWMLTKATTDFLISFGSQISAFANEDAGFWWDSATSQLRWWVRTASTTTSGTIAGIDMDSAHTYRVELNGMDASFYVDNVLYHVQTTGLPTGTDAAYIRIMFRTTTAATKAAYIIDASYVSNRYFP